ncbi:PAS domain-containing protein [Rhodocytophaga rosea]|uniref:PAS domain-containing protein n=1 Tax=Rhodocytophaga rosea TaxID=2704465 RepID=A0A6C0GI51_9BACT|nr:PAS domain-containing protein [Rhodocytophaga rosea]QHT67585.1 PAS domain-containing protein [Rhodocytophaga rosea]
MNTHFTRIKLKTIYLLFTLLLGIIILSGIAALLYIDEWFQNKTMLQTGLLVGTLLPVVLLVFTCWAFPAFLFKPLQQLQHSIHQMAQGNTSIQPNISATHEIGEITIAMQQLSTNIQEASLFATSIGEGKLDVEFTPVSKQDVLGNVLIQMRDKLLHVSEESQQRSWVNEGVAVFAEILRSIHNIDELSHKIISQLVSYMNANQGGLFIVNNENTEDIHLELAACYAYQKKKHLKKRIDIGEGLVGQVYLEKDTIYMTDVPAEYVHITSGLGEATPRSILLVPIQVNDTFEGVIELASFQQMLPYQIQFIEKISENIASTIANAKINERTKHLLESSQRQAEQLRAQEEEMRQNMEELSAIQEEMGRKQIELSGQIAALNHAAIVSEVDLKGNIIFANDEFCRMAKYTSEELIGQKQSIVRHPDMPAEVFIDLWATITKGKVWKGEVKNRAKDGSHYWVAATITPVLNEHGRPVKYIGVRFDITAQKDQEDQIKEDFVQLQTSAEELQAQEEELRQNMEELTAIQEEMTRKQVELDGQIAALNNAAIVSEVDLKGNIIFVNDEFCRLAKYSREELIGQKQSIVRHPDMPASLFDDLWATISKGRVWQGEVKNRAKDGSHYWVAATITPVLNEMGRPVKYIGVRFDITAQKEHQEIINSKIVSA